VYAVGSVNKAARITQGGESFQMSKFDHNQLSEIGSRSQYSTERHFEQLNINFVQVPLFTLE